MGKSYHLKKQKRKEQIFRFLDSIFFMTVILFLTFIVLHGKQVSTFIIGGAADTDIELKILEPSYNTTLAWLGMFVMPFLLQYLRTWNVSITRIGFWGSAFGVLCCLGYFLFFPIKSPIIFFTQGFLYAVTIVVVGIETYLNHDHTSNFWELIFSTISKLVGFIIVLYGAGSAVLRYISSQSQESVDGYISSFLYPTVIIVGVLFMLGYWILIPVLEKIHEKNLVSLSSDKTHWWPSMFYLPKKRKRLKN